MLRNAIHVSQIHLSELISRRNYYFKRCLKSKPGHILRVIKPGVMHQHWLSIKLIVHSCSSDAKLEDYKYCHQFFREQMDCWCIHYKWNAAQIHGNNLYREKIGIACNTERNCYVKIVPKSVHYLMIASLKIPSRFIFDSKMSRRQRTRS